MTVRVNDAGWIELLGACPSADAEALLQYMLADPAATVDWRQCRGAHTSVVQVLMAVKPKLLGPPADGVLNDWVAPAISSNDRGIS